MTQGLFDILAFFFTHCFFLVGNRWDLGYVCNRERITSFHRHQYIFSSSLSILPWRVMIWYSRWCLQHIWNRFWRIFKLCPFIFIIRNWFIVILRLLFLENDRFELRLFLHGIRELELSLVLLIDLDVIFVVSLDIRLFQLLFFLWLVISVVLLYFSASSDFQLDNLVIFTQLLWNLTFIGDHFNRFYSTSPII